MDSCADFFCFQPALITGYLNVSCSAPQSHLWQRSLTSTVTSRFLRWDIGQCKAPNVHVLCSANCLLLSKDGKSWKQNMRKNDSVWQTFWFSFPLTKKDVQLCTHNSNFLAGQFFLCLFRVLIPRGFLAIWRFWSCGNDCTMSFYGARFGSNPMAQAPWIPPTLLRPALTWVFVFFLLHQADGRTSVFVILMTSTAQIGTEHLMSIREVPRHWEKGRCDKLGPIWNPPNQNETNPWVSNDFICTKSCPRQQKIGFSWPWPHLRMKTETDPPWRKNKLLLHSGDKERFCSKNLQLQYSFTTREKKLLLFRSRHLLGCICRRLCLQQMKTSLASCVLPSIAEQPMVSLGWSEHLGMHWVLLDISSTRLESRTWKGRPLQWVSRFFFSRYKGKQYLLFGENKARQQNITKLDSGNLMMCCLMPSARKA